MIDLIIFLWKECEILRFEASDGTSTSSCKNLKTFNQPETFLKHVAVTASRHWEERPACYHWRVVIHVHHVHHVNDDY